MRRPTLNTPAMQIAETAFSPSHGGVASPAFQHASGSGMHLLHVGEPLALTIVNVQVSPCCFDTAIRPCGHHLLLHHSGDTGTEVYSPEGAKCGFRGNDPRCSAVRKRGF